MIIRKAGIDIGSNSVRILIVDLNTDTHTMTHVAYDRAITRLAETIIIDGKLSERSINETVDTLVKFRRLIELKHVPDEYIFTVATSAVREASNSDEFIKRAKIEANIDVVVIDGNKEAELTATGSVFGLTDDIKQRNSNVIIFDVGGGSTEFIVYDLRTKKIMFKQSLPIGVVKIASKFHCERTMNDTMLQEMYDFIDSELNDIRKIEHTTNDVLIGTSGTASSFLISQKSIEAGSHIKYQEAFCGDCTIKRNKIDQLTREIMKVDYNLRAEKFYLEKKREDVVVAGGAILYKIMDILNFDKVYISKYGLKEGLCLSDKIY